MDKSVAIYGKTSEFFGYQPDWKCALCCKGEGKKIRKAKFSRLFCQNCYHFLRRRREKEEKVLCWKCFERKAKRTLVCNGKELICNACWWDAKERDDREAVQREKNKRQALIVSSKETNKMVCPKEDLDRLHCNEFLEPVLETCVCFIQQDTLLGYQCKRCDPAHQGFTYALAKELLY
jgi:hypothetical protein